MLAEVWLNSCCQFHIDVDCQTIEGDPLRTPKTPAVRDDEFSLGATMYWSSVLRADCIDSQMTQGQ